MHLDELRVEGFRNLKPFQIKVPDRLNLFVGKNAQGKTNILESICILSNTRSFRSSRYQEFIPWGKTEFSIGGSVNTSIGNVELMVNGEDKSKRCYVNGDKVTKAIDYFGRLATQSFVPEDLNIIKGGAANRRKFIDQSLCSVDKRYVSSLSNFNKIIRQKNKLFSERAYDQIEHWNSLLVKEADVIINARISLVDDVKEIYNSYLLELSGSREVSTLSYESTLKTVSLEFLQSLLPEERARGVSCFGPHRDEIHVLLNDKPARKWASQGQSRCCALALILAVADVVKSRTKNSPILLLDDVESELDETRQKSLYQLVQSLDSQVFVTATDASQVSNLFVENGRLFNVDQGEIRAC